MQKEMLLVVLLDRTDGLCCALVLSVANHIDPLFNAQLVLRALECTGIKCVRCLLSAAVIEQLFIGCDQRQDSGSDVEFLGERFDRNS